MPSSSKDLNEIDYKKIIDAMTESIWIGDSEERTIYANPNFCNLLGYTLEEMLGRESYDFWDEESTKTVQKNNLSRKEGKSSKYEGVLRGKNGELVPVLLSGTPLGNGGTAGIMTDLREIRAVREEAEHFQAMSAMKDEFISMAGHELRTPMTGIRGYISMILAWDAWEITPATEKFLKIVLSETERLVSMVNDMLDIAKLEAGKMEFHDEKIELIPFAKGICDELQFLAEERGIRLQFLDDSLLNDKFILADKSKLKQVIINLIGNALKFTPSGESITFKLSKTEKSEALFEVIDTGIGIPLALQEKIFEKFWQADNYLQKSVAGTGLGLYICKKILSHFNTDLLLNSVESKGSNFYFSITLAC